MNESIKVFHENSKEYKRLEAAASFIQSETGKVCKVNDILFDAGQNWMWTTISMESGLSTFPFVQVLSSKQQNMIVFGERADWMNAVEEVCDNQKNKSE